MRERPENLVRNAGPLLAAALCVWGAASFADELPDSVRERALQELRVLDRGTSHPAPDVSRAAQTSNASRRTVPSAAEVVCRSPASRTELPLASRQTVTPLIGGSPSAKVPLTSTS